MRDDPVYLCSRYEARLEALRAVLQTAGAVLSAAEVGLMRAILDMPARPAEEISAGSLTPTETDAGVREVDFGNVSDIPAQMEAMAADLRAGEHGKVRFGVCVILGEDGIPIVCGWGQDADEIHAIGLLHLGATWLSEHKVRRNGKPRWFTTD